MPRATSSTSAALAATHSALAHRLLGNTGLTITAAGFGCYRVDVEVEEHHTALEKALLGGVNLIDTSANYTDGHSERLVGAVLARLTGAGLIQREQVVVVTKAGYLQGQNYQQSQERKEAGQAWPELLELEPGLEHCLHPDFLADQIAHSLERLGLDCIDVLLLHNPEYFWQWAREREIPAAEAKAEYYRRIGQAFAHLEQEVAQGRIGAYGISSNTFPLPADHPDFTSLAEVWQRAEALAGGHHFQVIEFPCNLLEPGAMLNPNQPGGQSLLELARDLGLGVLINRPLNAMSPERGLLRLADLEPVEPPTPEELLEHIAKLRVSEEDLTARLLPELGLEPGQAQQVAGYLSTAPTLADHWNELQGLEHWRHLEGEYFLPRIHAALQFIHQTKGPSPELEGLLNRHLALVGQAFGAVGAVYRMATAQELAQVRGRAAAADPVWDQAPSLSRLALRALWSTLGVSCVLVGMRRPPYVAEVLAELAAPVGQEPRRQSWLKLAASGS